MRLGVMMSEERGHVQRARRWRSERRQLYFVPELYLSRVAGLARCPGNVDRVVPGRVWPGSSLALVVSRLGRSLDGVHTLAGSSALVGHVTDLTAAEAGAYAAEVCSVRGCEFRQGSTRGVWGLLSLEGVDQAGEEGAKVVHVHRLARWQVRLSLGARVRSAGWQEFRFGLVAVAHAGENRVDTFGYANSLLPG